MIDYQHEETETDRMSDAQRPMTEAERDRIIKRISKEIEALDDGGKQERTAPSSMVKK